MHVKELKIGDKVTWQRRLNLHIPGIVVAIQGTIVRLKIYSRGKVGKAAVIVKYLTYRKINCPELGE